MKCKEQGKIKNFTFESTSQLRRHLQGDHNINLGSTSPAKSQPSLNFVVKKMDMESPRAQKITELIAALITQDLHPVSVVTGSAFQNLLAFFEPSYVIPSTTYFSDTVIPKKYEEKKREVIKELSAEEYVALTSDIWTSRNQDPFIGITCHWINEDWILREVNLATKHFPEEHTGANIALKIVESQVNLGLTFSISGVTTDSGSNMVAGTKNWDWIACFGHLIQLCLGDALKDSPKIQEFIQKSKEIVNHFKRSPKAAIALKKIVLTENSSEKKYKVVQDVKTRWNSTFHMLQRLKFLRKSINQYVKDEKKFELEISEKEYLILEQLEQFLEPLEEVTELCSGSKYPSLSLVLPLSIIVVKKAAEGTLRNDLDPDVKTFVQKLHLKLKERLLKSDIDRVAAVATMLNPKFKDRMWMRSTDALYDKLSKIFKEEYDTFLLKVPPANEPDILNQPAKKIKMMDSLFPKNNQDDEFSRYLNTSASADLKNLDALEWWKLSEGVYPNLAKMARIYLAIMATSVPCERLFSKGSNIVTKQRQNLKPKNVEMLMFLSANK